MILEASIQSVPTQIISFQDLNKALQGRQPSLIWDLLEVNRESRDTIRRQYIFVTPGKYRESIISRKGWRLHKARDTIHIAHPKRRGDTINLPIILKEDVNGICDERFVTLSRLTFDGVQWTFSTNQHIVSIVSVKWKG
jgi:hypothetical protein